MGSLLAAVLSLFVGHRSEAAVQPGDELGAIADQLAQQVLGQWRREEEHRKVNDPVPLPVRWHPAAEHLVDDWADICQVPVGAAGDQLELAGGLDQVTEVYRRIPSGPLQRRHTIAALLDQAHTDMPTVTPVASEGPTVAECGAKLARYRAALEAGADPAVVAGWIAETQTERHRAEQHQRTAVEEKTDIPPRLSEDQIIAVVEEFGDLVSALRDAEPEHKLEVYRSLGLNLTYDPETQTVRASVDLATHRWDSFVSEGELNPHDPHRCAL